MKNKYPFCLGKGKPIKAYSKGIYYKIINISTSIKYKYVTVIYHYHNNIGSQMTSWGKIFARCIKQVINSHKI